jgi:hypothetical protein
VHHQVIRDARVGSPWIGSGVVGKAAFMLVREVSVRADMVNNRFRWGEESSNLKGLILDSRELSRDLNKRYS